LSVDTVTLAACGHMCLCGTALAAAEVVTHRSVYSVTWQTAVPAAKLQLWYTFDDVMLLNQI